MSGWGLVSFVDKEAQNLQKLDLPVLSKESCRSINVPHMPNYFSKRMEWQILCAGYENSIFINYVYIYEYSIHVLCLQKTRPPATVTAVVRW